SGSLPHSSYEIATPVATVGIRGTTLEWIVGESGLSTIALSRGSIIVMNMKGKSVTLKPGEATTVLPPDGDGNQDDPSEPGPLDPVLQSLLWTMTVMIRANEPSDIDPGAGGTGDGAKGKPATAAALDAPWNGAFDFGFGGFPSLPMLFNPNAVPLGLASGTPGNPASANNASTGTPSPPGNSAPPAAPAPFCTGSCTTPISTPGPSRIAVGTLSFPGRGGPVEVAVQTPVGPIVVTSAEIIDDTRRAFFLDGAPAGVRIVFAGGRLVDLSGHDPIFDLVSFDPTQGESGTFTAELELTDRAGDTFDFALLGVIAVAEPGSAALVLLGLGGILLTRRRRGR
ncbi:MAG: PEP-CTERM sorting domain-containing protein, partial [Alphaproteobacteria bacterium]|nr:PEP-CTERM sorting domain-containing protein [Alphaproteobacteria bacterium]